MTYRNPLDYLLKKIFDEIVKYSQRRGTSISETEWRVPSEIIIRDERVFRYLAYSADFRMDARISVRRGTDGIQPQLYLWDYPATYIPRNICLGIADSAVIIPDGFWPFKEGAIL